MYEISIVKIIEEFHQYHLQAHNRLILSINLIPIKFTLEIKWISLQVDVRTVIFWNTLSLGVQRWINFQQ